MHTVLAPIVPKTMLENTTGKYGIKNSSSLRLQIGPFSWRNPSREEHPGPPTHHGDESDWRAISESAHTIGPEQKILDVRSIVGRPEPARCQLTRL